MLNQLNLRRPLATVKNLPVRLVSESAICAGAFPYLAVIADVDGSERALEFDASGRVSPRHADAADLQLVNVANVVTLYLGFLSADRPVDAFGGRRALSVAALTSRHKVSWTEVVFRNVEAGLAAGFSRDQLLELRFEDSQLVRASMP